LPHSNDIESINVENLISYLQNSHHYYRDKCLPGIQYQLERITNDARTQGPTKLLQQFYHGYQTEVLNHFKYEDTVAFPYVIHLTKGDNTDIYKISQFEENHSNIEEKLNDLKNIIIKYLPDVASRDELNTLLFQLFELEDDFRKHTLIENKILVPLVLQLEQQRI